MADKYHGYLEFDNIDDFNVWHERVKIKRGMSGGGLVSVRASDGRRMPNVQRTTDATSPEIHEVDGTVICEISDVHRFLPEEVDEAKIKGDQYRQDRQYVNLDAEGNRILPSGYKAKEPTMNPGPPDHVDPNNGGSGSN